MSKLINVNCLHFIRYQNYTNTFYINCKSLLYYHSFKAYYIRSYSCQRSQSTVRLLLAIVMTIIFGPLKTLPRSSKSCDCVTFGVLRYLLSTFHCHMILSKQKCCLLSTGALTESQYFSQGRVFSNKKYDSYKCCDVFIFLVENINVQFDGMVYQQIVGIPMGTNCAHLNSSLEIVQTIDSQLSGRFRDYTYSRFIFILLWEGLYVLPSRI